MTSDSVLDELELIDQRSRNVTATGAQAFQRMLCLAETHNSGQIAWIASFMAATCDGEAIGFNLCKVRAGDGAISVAMLHCIDALRWGCADLRGLVLDGEARTRAVIDRWGIRKSG